MAARPAPRRPRRPTSAHSRDRVARWRTAALGALALLVSVALTMVAIGGGAARTVVSVVLIFGVPAVLAVVTATVIVRRSG